MQTEKTLSLPFNSSLLSEDSDFINALIKASLLKNISFSLYQLPGESNLFFIGDFSGKNEIITVELEEQQGFIFSPFDTSKPSYFIKADILINLSQKKLQHRAEMEAQVEEFLKDVQDIASGPDTSIVNSLPPVKNFQKEEVEEFRDKVEKAVQKINDGELKKVVLSRSKVLSLPSEFNFAESLYELCKDPNAFVSLTYINGESIWMGASPELLVSIDRNRNFQTVALAGTQSLSNYQEISKAVWTQKEIEEQALVSRYIINCFKTIRLREFEEDGPRTTKAGNLIHLKTTFTVNMDEVNFPTLGSIMLDLLHPTSAVCGMPKDKAMDFIRNNENTERKFYSGFLGPVNLNSETHIYVNIRCAEFGKENVVIYSGAGITQESDPGREFTETELKMKVMERVIINKS